MQEHPEIKPNSQTRNKSQWASRAIQWFFDSPLLERERDPESGDFTGKYRVAPQGAPHPIDLFLKIDALEEELNQVSCTCQVANNEANHTSPGWVKRVISRIVGH